MTIVDKMMVIMLTIMVLVDLGPFSVDIHSVPKPFCFKIVESCPPEHVSQRCQHCHRVSERTREREKQPSFQILHLRPFSRFTYS